VSTAKNNRPRINKRPAARVGRTTGTTTMGDRRPQPRQALVTHRVVGSLQKCAARLNFHKSVCVASLWTRSFPSPTMWHHKNWWAFTAWAPAASTSGPQGASMVRSTAPFTTLPTGIPCSMISRSERGKMVRSCWSFVPGNYSAGSRLLHSPQCLNMLNPCCRMVFALCTATPEKYAPRHCRRGPSRMSHRR
jgi:hypothetical protein